jgi:hypothetical protein
MLKQATVVNVRTWKFAPSPGANPLQLFITYLYSIEGQEVAMTSRKCAHVTMDLPTRVEITAPPLIVETTTVE